MRKTLKLLIAGLMTAALVSTTVALAAGTGKDAGGKTVSGTVSGTASGSKKPSRVPLPMTKAVQGEQCVEPTELMRRDHMEMILHQRDETVHRGLRTIKHSLKNCVNCHADPKTGSVLGQNGFCESCHTYAAVTMDCFSCHTDKAEKKITGVVHEPDTLGKLVRGSIPAVEGKP